MVLYRRRQQAKAPLKSDKHEVTWSSLGQNASTTQSVVLAVGVASADKDSSSEVEVGAHIRNVYIEFNVSAETITSTKVFHWWLKYDYSGQTDENPNSYYQAQRSQVLKRGMEMLVKDVSTQTKRIISVRIPPKFSRMTMSTGLKFQYIASSSESINVCGFAIYKEFY